MLLRKNDYQTEDFFFLLFYVPNEVTETGEVIFDTDLKKMKVNVKNTEKIFESVVKLLNDNCHSKSYDWCEEK